MLKQSEYSEENENIIYTECDGRGGEYLFIIYSTFWRNQGKVSESRRKEEAEL